MFKKMSLLPVACFLLGASLIHAAQTSTTEAPNITISQQQLPKTVLKICGVPEHKSDLRRWQPNLRFALERLRSDVYGTQKAFSIQFVPMGECADLGANSCYGKAGTVLCNETVLERIVYAAAMTSGFQMLTTLQQANSNTPESGKRNVWTESLRNLDSSELGAIEALSLIDAVEADQAILGVYAPGETTKLQKRKQHLADAFGSRANDLIENAFTAAWGLQEIDLNLNLLKDMPHDEALFFETMHVIFQATLDETLYFVLGHELAHAHNGCLVSTPLPKESEIRYKQFLDIQKAGNIFCPNPPSISELNAERCALRVLYSADKLLQRRERIVSTGYMVNRGFLDIGRRHAIDLLGFFMAAKIGQSTQIVYAPYAPFPVIDGRPQYFPEMKDEDGYLYSALRLLLIADLLHSLSDTKQPGVGVCGANAERLMETILRARIGCEKHALKPLKELTIQLDKLSLPMAHGVATFFTYQTHKREDLSCEAAVTGH